MAPSGKRAVDFDTIINANRQRRKHEALAQEIFSKGRRSSAPGAGVSNRKPGTGPSLASRVGVAKRTASTTSTSQKLVKPSSKPASGNVDAEWTHDLYPLSNPSVSRVSQLPLRTPKASRVARNNRLYSALSGSASSSALNSQFNITNSSKPSTRLSIRGLAGPYVVMAKNFAQGTTAADIESAMVPVGGIVLSCRLIAERPNVIAEIIFETKEGADNVVDTFNNQNADGNLLHVYQKTGAVAIPPKLLSARSAPVPTAPRSVTPLGPRADIVTDRSDSRSDARYAGSDRYAPLDRSQDRGRDNDRDEIMDGSYGFEDRMDTDDRDDNGYEKGSGRGLYSDRIVGGRNGRGHGDSRDRGRGNERGRGFR